MLIRNYLEELPENIRVVGVSDILLDAIACQLSLKQLSKLLSVNYRTFVRYFTKNRAIPLGVLKEVLKKVSNSNVEYMQHLNRVFVENNGFKSNSSKSNKVRLPIRFSKGLCYLIGALHDGTVFSNKTKNQYLIQFWQFRDDKWLLSVAELFNEVFGITPKKYSNYI